MSLVEPIVLQLSSFRFGVLCNDSVRLYDQKTRQPLHQFTAGFGLGLIENYVPNL
ncbi:MAG: hypothetical protein U0996_21560 [Planctomycetaceae bacterium]